MRLVHREASGYLNVTAGNPLLDDRRRVDGVIEHDRKAPPDVLRGHRVEDVRAAIVELDGDVRTLEPRAGTHARIGNDVAGHQHRCFDQVRLAAAGLRGAVEDFVAGRRTVLDRVLHVLGVVNQLEFEHRGFADQFLGALGVLDAGELHQDFVVTFFGDGGFAHAELIDSIADGLERLVHRVRSNRLQLLRLVRHRIDRTDAA